MNVLIAAGQHEVEAFLLRVLVQLIVIVLAARVGGWLFRKLGQPQVCGEIAAGILLGPSCLGYFAPQFAASIFPPDPQLTLVFKVLAELGLVFMMFLVGLEFEFGLLKQMGRTAAMVSAAGVALPFVLGLGLAQFLHPRLAADRDWLGFTLFMAIALSITAMPVLARIMLEMKLTRTRIGVLAITAAAVGDATGWLLLAGITAAVRGEFDPWQVTIMLGETIAFVLGTLLIVRPLAKRWIGSLQLGESGELTAGQFAIVIAVIFAAALATNTIGIFAIFGPFVLGASLWDEVEFRNAIQRRLGDFVMVFFLPIFFTLTGLRTRIETLNDVDAWLWCGVILVAAIFGKLCGCGLSARLSRQFTWGEAASIGVMMNTRGLMELIVINLGRELGVLPDSVFCMLVIMAVVTTYMTAPLLNRLIRHEPEMLAGGDGAVDRRPEPVRAVPAGERD